MRFQLVSDLHLEFQPFEIINNGAQVLILAGDICVADYFKRSEASPKHVYAQKFRKFFEQCSAEFPYVIYILGNHEHYHGRFDDTVNTLRGVLADLPNIYILDNTSVDIGDVRFVGTTLWTNFNNDMWSAKLAVKGALNDYHCVQRVRNGCYRKLTPDDTLSYHQAALVNIDHHARSHDNVIVVGHHAPSLRSIDPKYASSGLINYGYASDLEQFIADRPSIKAWIHGHTHSSHDYVVADTRILCNPRGYASPKGVPENPAFDPLRVFDI